MHNYLTEDSIEKIRKEIEHRKVVVRKTINEDLKEARAHGDLSENFEYKAAKRDRARNESRIRFLERMIKTAIIIENDTDEDQVGVGKKVTIRFLEDDDVDEYLIVTTVDADPFENKVSIESPIGKAMYKHKIGEKVNVEAPSGVYSIKIEKVEVLQ